MAYAIITGASKGIGKAMAEELARRKHDLILVARNEALLEKNCRELQERYGVDCRHLAMDKADADSHTRMLEFVQSENLPVDILINNAGIGVYDHYEESELDHHLRMNELNVNAVLRWCHTLIPELKKQKKSYLLNVASLGGFAPVPGMSTYGGTKAYVISFSRALRFEQRGSGLSVSVLCPGGVRTDFARTAGSYHVENKMRWATMTPERQAKLALRGMFRGKAEIIPGFVNKLSRFMVWAMPLSMTIRSTARIFAKQ